MPVATQLKPTPVYAATIVALAVHFVVQLCYPAQDRLYQSVAEVEIVPSDASFELPRSDVQAWWKARGVPQPSAVHVVQLEQDTVVPVWLATIRVAARDAKTAQTRADRLARQFVAWQNERWSEKWQSARARYDWRLQEALHYERKARQALESFLVVHFEQHARLAANGRHGESGSTSESESDTSGSVSEADPLVAKYGTDTLERERLILQQQIDQLKQTRTEAHPEMRHLRQQLARIEDALRVAEEQAERVRKQRPARLAATPAVARRIVTDETVESPAGRFEALWEDLREAENERRALLDRPQSIIDELAAPPVLRIRSALQAKPLAPRPDYRRHVVAWTTSLLVGGVVLWLAGSCRPLRYVNGADDAADLLQIPVLGELAAPSLDVDERERLERRWARLRIGLRVGEWTLVAVACWVVYQAWTTSQFAVSFRQDVWETLAGSIQSLRYGVGN